MRALAAFLIAGCSSATPPATTPVGTGSSSTTPAVASVCIAGTGGVRLGEITATSVQFCFDTYGDAEEPTTTCYARDVRSGVVTSTPVRAMPKPAEDDGAEEVGDVLAIDAKRGLAVHRLEDGLTVAVKTKAGKVQAKFQPEVEPTQARFVPAGILFTFVAAGPGSDAAFHAIDGKLIDRVGGPVKEGDDAAYINLYTAGQNPIDLADGRFVFLDAGGDFIVVHAASGKLERRVEIAPPDSKTRELSEEEMMDADIGGHDSMTLLPDGKLAVVRGFPRYGSISLVDLASGTSTHLPAPERCVKPAAAPAN